MFLPGGERHPPGFPEGNRATHPQQPHQPQQPSTFRKN